MSIAEIATDVMRRAAASIYANVPVRSWPKAVGLLCELHVPKRVRAYAKPTPTSPSNINILLDLLQAVDHVPGAIAECDVFQGSSLVTLALDLQQRGKIRQVFGFDSFEGFGDSIIADLDLERTLVDPKMKASGFSDTSVDRVRAKSQVFGLNNVTLVKGYFEESLPRFPETTFAFVHLDCDTYSAYRECLAYFYPRLSPGGIIVFDEYDDEAWPGCKIAVDEFFTDRPERLQIICRDNYVKTYFCKE